LGLAGACGASLVGRAALGADARATIGGVVATGDSGRRIESQHLTRRGKERLGFGERCSCLEHRRQVARVVLDDPVQRPA
jgi:hypothetical protein